MFRYYIIFVFCIWGISGKTQDSLDYYKVDKLTYQYYIDKNWDSICKVGRLAIKKNIDYFYLRMRIGIAYFEKGKYFKSTHHFKKAREYNSYNDVLNEYLYYSLIYSGLYNEAEHLASSFKESLKTKLNLQEHSCIKNISVDAVHTFNNDYKNLLTGSINDEFAIANFRTILKNQTYGGISLSHNLGKHFSVTHGYQFLTINNIQQIKLANRPKEQFTQTTLQNAYYLCVTKKFKKNAFLSIAVQNIWITSNFLDVGFDTIPFPPRPVYKNSIYSSTDQSYTIDFTKRFYNTEFLLTASYSGLNRGTQIQAGGGIIYFPLGNRKLFFALKTIYFAEEIVNAPYSDIIIMPSVNFNLKKINFNIHTSTGDIHNFADNSGYIIYNDIDYITSKSGISFIYSLNKNIDLSARYNYLLKSGYAHINTTPDKIEWKEYKYSTQSFIVGLKYIFR